MLRTRILAVVLVAVAPLLAGCIGDAPTVALLVADGSDSSSRAVDAEVFADRVEATCDECRVVTYDAEGDATTQKSQARQAEASSADVIVVVPVDPGDLASVTGRDVPVVSLGTLVPDSDRFVGLAGTEVPTQTGSDLDAAREIVLGEEESMTYVPTRAMSEQAADVAVGILADQPVDGGEAVDGIESWLYRDREVTVDSLTSVLVRQGAISLEELCSGPTARKCTSLGLR